ncbi:membrane-bound O-acyltransferase [Scandinavium sp. TWS1a]|uniref:MBOAT family O-acyltransferase n=1 Tax=Scandinavium tedordense TaxID=2926521 RepID=UPI00135B2CD3|nr:MBOAT family O-acyltransferase [Scandinavium tedordense]MCS2172553.1 membrane-bound O-acyltransferase [Scandinavium tedordense]
MYSNASFFVYLFSSALLFAGINRFLKYRLTYLVSFSVIALIGWAHVFRGQFFIPIAVFLCFYVVTYLKDKKYLKTWQAVSLTLLPLVLVKLHLNNHWGMIGLSFMTFRAIDVLLYRKKEEAKSFITYFCYLFLPFVILAGPMYRWNTWVKDIRKPTFTMTTELFLQAMQQIFYGIVQKFLFAMLIDHYVISHWRHHDFTLTVGIVMSVAYSFYLYFDFAGYSNMAMGAGRLFGLNIPQNFNFPLLAKNPQDFWRRFHISLSEWLRDVIFMPVYMHLLRFAFFRNNKTCAQNIGIFCTLFCMGAWNGLERHYVISGILFGLISVSHNMLLWTAKRQPLLEQWLKYPVVSLCGRFLTLASAAVSLYIFSGMSPL